MRLALHCTALRYFLHLPPSHDATIPLQSKKSKFQHKKRKSCTFPSLLLIVQISSLTVLSASAQFFLTPPLGATEWAQGKFQVRCLRTLGGHLEGVYSFRFVNDVEKRFDDLNLQITGGEARVARSDILSQLAISENLELDTDVFDEIQIIASNNS